MTSPWDRRLAARAAAVGSLALGGGFAILVMTDDGATWARRAAVLAAVAPLAGALGALVTMRRAEARGELRALEALGATPFRASLGAAAGGVLIGLAGTLLVRSRFADLAALFPTPAAPRTWVVDGPSAMRELSTGLRVATGAGLERVPGTRLAVPRPDHALVALCFTLCALAAPTWIAARFSASNKPWAWSACVAGLAVVVGLVAFQAVAAAKAGPPFLLAAPLVLVADAVLAAWAGRRAS